LRRFKIPLGSSVSPSADVSVIWMDGMGWDGMGWMDIIDGWMDGWIDGCMDRWMDGWISANRFICRDKFECKNALCLPHPRLD
jgi:hypothetical protein